MEPTENKGLEQAGARSLRFHGSEPVRGLQDVARSALSEGRFGRMFRHLPPFLPEDADLSALAATMIQDVPAGGDDNTPSPDDNPAIPAGFTYLGQFIDHDITFDPASKLQRENDPNALHDFRTPRFDLDSLYGRGPDDEPYLYKPDGVSLLLGQVEAGDDDLPRNANGRAIIGDPRNDENLIVSQLQLAFLKYHNQVVQDLLPKISDSQARFDEARRVVRWHYQWIVTHQFLHHIVGRDVVSDVLKEDTYLVASGSGHQEVHRKKADLKFFKWDNDPFMPVEFSVAAYRFGHSMIRFDYELNDDENAQNVPLFQEPPVAPKFDLRGFRARPPGHKIQWHRFYAFSGADNPQPTRKIDTKLEHGLGTLPLTVAAQGPHSLAARNLQRGKALGLPSGQDVARAMGIPHALRLSAADLGLSPALQATFGEDTPLWYYILKEAEVKCNGKRLGPVGGRIVAEVLIGLLDGDPASYLSVDPNWEPTANEFGAGPHGEFGMENLLRHAGVTI